MSAPERSAARALHADDLMSISEQHLAALNTLYSCGGQNQSGYEWRWQHTALSSVDHWLRLENGARFVYLGITDASVCDDIDFNWRDFEADAQLLAWCASYGPVLDSVQSALNGNWTPAGLFTDAVGSDSLIEAGFIVRHNSKPVAIGRCLLGRDEVVRVTENGRQIAPSLHLPLEIPVVVDRATFSIDDLAKFEIGAVVRVSKRAFLNIGVPLRLNVGEQELQVEVSGSRLTVVAINAARAND